MAAEPLPPGLAARIASVDEATGRLLAGLGSPAWPAGRPGTAAGALSVAGGELPPLAPWP